MSELVTIETRDGIADVRLNRPDKHNSLTLEMFHAIAAAGQALKQDASTRVAVLSGNGPSFCAGLDMSLMQGLLAGGEVTTALLAELGQRGDGPENLAQRVALTWKTAPIPVIAALTGVSYGGGCQIALGCDFRIAAPDATLCVMEIRYGLIPDMSITQTLPRLVRPDVAKELVMTGRIVEAGEALALGMLTRIEDEPLEAAFDLARTIASRSPDAVRANKKLLNDTEGADTAAALALEESLQFALIGSRNQGEAVRASMEKREPRFEDAAPFTA